MPRVCVIGLDCLAPQLVFETFRERLPTFNSLLQPGCFGPLRSCNPPITVPAWAVMVTGQDPGALGIYGFQDRKNRSYHDRRLASSLDVGAKTLWEQASAQGLFSRVISVPLTHPPKPFRGELVSDCLTPELAQSFTYPAALATEVNAITGGYMFDVPAHRHQDRAELLAAVEEMTRRRFHLARTWLSKNDWDFFMMVEMGPDRMHHAFWRYMAKDHPLHEKDHPFGDAIASYYEQLDQELKTTLALIRPDDALLIVSDHGAQTMRGGIALNQWLVDNGYLVLRKIPSEPTPFSKLDVDWSKTRAFGDGGYVGRVHLNIQGREPVGIVKPEEVEPLLRHLRDGLAEIRGVQNEVIKTQAFRPQEIYTQCRGVPPDLIVHFDGLAYRALGSVGHPQLAVVGNDTGPDDANHAEDGVVIMRGGDATLPRTILDIAPWVRRVLRLA